eukprot:8451793-Pyramimonas_sp.AAC.1
MRSSNPILQAGHGSFLSYEAQGLPTPTAAQSSCNGMSSRAAAESLAAEAAGTGPEQPQKIPTDGGHGLRKFILEQYRDGEMTATMACTICHYATQAGARGVDDIASHPSQRSHRAEHLRKALRVRSKDSFFTAKIPMWDKDTESRILGDFPVNLPFDVFEEEFAQDCDQFNPAKFPVDSLPPTFKDHVVTLANPGKTCPF